MSCPSRSRAPQLFNPNKDYRTQIQLYRAGACFTIPVSCLTKNGFVKKKVARLIKEATRENIALLERCYHVQCEIKDVPLLQFA